jgi:hypothetical protein
VLMRLGNWVLRKPRDAQRSMQRSSGRVRAHNFRSGQSPIDAEWHTYIYIYKYIYHDLYTNWIGRCWELNTSNGNESVDTPLAMNIFICVQKFLLDHCTGGSLSSANCVMAT